MSTTSTITATHFRREDVLCTICRSPLPAGTHRRLSKPPSLPSESAFCFFSCLREPIVVEGECKPCSAKLEKGCKTIVHMAWRFMPSNRSQATSVLAACSCEVKTAFPDFEKPSQLAQLSARSRFRSCRHNVAFPYQVKSWNWKTILRLCALQHVSKVCAT